VGGMGFFLLFLVGWVSNDGGPKDPSLKLGRGRFTALLFLKRFLARGKNGKKIRKNDTHKRATFSAGFSSRGGKKAPKSPWRPGPGITRNTGPN